MVSKAEILRLIYQGRFLHCNVTLGALGLPMGKTTVMHLVPRDNLPEPNSQGSFVVVMTIDTEHNMFNPATTFHRSTAEEQRRFK